MPNGESRNWIRMLITLEGYYAIYGKWPSSIRLDPFFIEELRTKLRNGDFSRLEKKIRLIADEDNPFLAEGEAGKTYDYARDKNPQRVLSINAISWMGVSPPEYFV